MLALDRRKELMRVLEFQPTMTVEQYAALIGVSRGAAYQAVKNGEVATLTLGRRILVLCAPLRRQLGFVA